jgi:hypothetical protein
MWPWLGLSETPLGCLLPQPLEKRPPRPKARPKSNRFVFGAIRKPNAPASTALLKILVCDW